MLQHPSKDVGNCSLSSNSSVSDLALMVNHALSGLTDVDDPETQIQA